MARVRNHDLCFRKMTTVSNLQCATQAKDPVAVAAASRREYLLFDDTRPVAQRLAERFLKLSMPREGVHEWQVRPDARCCSVCQRAAAARADAAGREPVAAHARTGAPPAEYQATSVRAPVYLGHPIVLTARAHVRRAVLSAARPRRRAGRAGGRRQAAARCEAAAGPVGCSDPARDPRHHHGHAAGARVQPGAQGDRRGVRHRHDPRRRPPAARHRWQCARHPRRARGARGLQCRPLAVRARPAAATAAEGGRARVLEGHARPPRVPRQVSAARRAARPPRSRPRHSTHSASGHWLASGQ
eukprot:6826345-Prymnesium_polylepis.1